MRGVPYAEAVRLAGSEKRLVADTAASTAAMWKTRGVPWHVLGPLLVAKNGHRPRGQDALATDILEELRVQRRLLWAILRALRRRSDRSVKRRAAR